MKTIVLYESGTGFTAQYADWIAKTLDCNCLPLKEFSAKKETYDRIVFGGWVFGSNIMGLDKLQKLGLKPAAVFAVGASPNNDEICQQISSQNKLKELPFFYFQGGFRFEKLSFIQRSMLKMVKKSVDKKEDKTPQDIFMSQVLGTSFDACDKTAVVPLVTYLANA